MNLTETLKKEWAALLLLALPFVVLPFVWDQLPDRVPIHWNIRGEADNYADKAFGVLLLPLLNVGLYLLLLAVPAIDPKHKVSSRQKPLRAFRFFMPLFMDAIFFVTLFQQLGYAFDIGRFIPLIVVFLLLVIGNYMSALRPNYFIGIRTPWTLEDPENWQKTHRMASKLWVGLSLLLLLLWVVTPPETFLYLFLGGVLIMAIAPLAYSFLLFLRKDRRPSGDASS